MDWWMNGLIYDVVGKDDTMTGPAMWLACDGVLIQGLIGKELVSDGGGTVIILIVDV